MNDVTREVCWGERMRQPDKFNIWRRAYEFGHMEATEYIHLTGKKECDSRTHGME